VSKADGEGLRGGAGVAEGGEKLETGDLRLEASVASHLPRGQRSVAMRSFAHVEHPHLRQRPVLFKAAASHSGQARHVASRVASASGGVVAKPERAKL